MTLPDRDDVPAGYSLTRRQILLGGLLGAAAAALPSFDVWALPAETGATAERFMALSALLIDHRLDSEVGYRLAAALRTRNPALPGQIEQLLSIAARKDAKVIEDFFPDVPAGALKETALAIIFAWYAGVLVDVAGTEVFAYEHALMYKPTSDVMTIPTYAISGPNGWNTDVPPLGDMPSF